MPTQDNLKAQLYEKKRRLQQLKLKEAHFGYSTPPEILLEIEDLEAEISKLQAQLTDSAPLYNIPEETMLRRYPKHLVRWESYAWLALALKPETHPSSSGSRHALLDDKGTIRWEKDMPGLQITGGTSVDQHRFLFSVAGIAPLDKVGSLHCINIARDEIWRWDANAGRCSAPTTVGDTAWITTNTRQLVGIDINTGQKIINHTLVNQPATTAPTITQNIAYIPGDTVLSAINLNGTHHWHYQVEEGFITHTPIVLESRIIAVNSNAAKSKVICLDKNNGQLMWQKLLPTGREGISAPNSDGERIFVGAKSGLYALNLINGSIIWSFPTSNKYFAARAILIDDLVFGTCYDHRFYAFDAATGSLRWHSTEVSQRIEVSPVIFPGSSPHAIVVDHGGATTVFTLPFAIAEKPPKTVVKVEPSSISKTTSPEMNHLTQRLKELEEPLSNYNEQIKAIEEDISLELDGQRKVILKRKLDKTKSERRKLQSEWDAIKAQLINNVSVTPTVKPEGSFGGAFTRHTANVKVFSRLLDGMALVSLPKFIDGNRQENITGSAWLIAPGLAITCWHVIEGRTHFEAPITESDLKYQIENTRLIFDYDQPDKATQYAVEMLLHHHRQLDYALLRLADNQHSPLAKRPFFKVDTSTQLALQNELQIMQHPQGGLQQYATGEFIGQNEHRLYYTTPTDVGSSGGPVLLSPTYHVVALHRGQRLNGDGKEGVRMQSIFNDLSQHKPRIYQEIINHQSEQEQI